MWINFIIYLTKSRKQSKINGWKKRSNENTKKTRKNSQQLLQRNFNLTKSTRNACLIV